MKTRFIGWILLWLPFASCVTDSAYLMSPLDINTHPYTTIPMVSDSFRSATYTGFAFNVGSSNESLRDGVTGARFNLERAHQFGYFQAYYGAGFNLGSYHVGDSYYGMSNFYDTVQYSPYHYLSRDRFYGGFGINGGINLVIPFGNGRGEWRILGLETSYQKEFGQYLNFRKSLVDSVFDIDAVYGHMFTLGGSTEIVGRTHHGTAIGYKVSLGTILFPERTYLGKANNFHPYYFSHCLNITKRRITGFMQLNIGANAVSFQTGINYRLGKK